MKWREVAVFLFVRRCFRMVFDVSHAVRMTAMRGKRVNSRDYPRTLELEAKRLRIVCENISMKSSALGVVIDGFRTVRKVSE